MLQADIGALTDAAGEVESEAAILADLDVATPFADASDALVASRTSEACLWVSTRLGAALQVYADGLGALAQASRVTAQDLSGTDRSVASGFGPVAR
jgi:hypothetical protein